MITAVLIVALWVSAAVGLTVGAVSLAEGAAPGWAVLRAVGAFTLFMLLGLLAEWVTQVGLSRPPPPQPEEPAADTPAERAPLVGEVISPQPDEGGGR